MLEGFHHRQRQRSEATILIELLGSLSTWHLGQVPPANLDIPILGQLAATQLPLSDALEPGPLEVVCLDAPLRGGPLRQ
jgi:hypothetical protein